MAKEKTKKAAKTAAPKAAAAKPKPSAAKAAMASATEQMASAGETARGMAAKAAANAGKINMTVIDQAEANTRAAFAAMRAAASAGSLGGVAKVQSAYVKEQGQRSMTQAREIGDLIAQFGRDAMEAMRGK
jgi:hypothetical protein